MQKTLTGIIKKVYAKHSPNNMWHYAKISLWAEVQTTNGSNLEVWLDKQEGLDTRRIEAKIREYETKNQHILGQNIRFKYDYKKDVAFNRSYELPIKPFYEN